MPATILKLYASGDVWVPGENPTSTKMNDNTLVHHQDEFERRDSLMFKWLQQVTTDDSVANTATYETFDVIVNGKRYYAASLSIDMTSLTVSTIYHVRLWASDMDLHVNTDSLDGDGLYIGTIYKDGAGAVTMTLLPCHLLVSGISATILAIMPSDATTVSGPMLIRYYGGVLETSVDNGGTWTALPTSLPTFGDIVSHDASEFATSAQGSLADSALQSGDIPVKATYAEVDTGTDTDKFITPASLQTSVRNVRHLGFAMVAPDVSLSASTSVKVGFSVESEIAGVIVSCGANNDTAGTTGTAVYDIHLNGTTIMASTKISIETGETSSKTAATQPVITTTALAVGDILTFFVDSIQSTAALGVTFKLNVRET